MRNLEYSRRTEYRNERVMGLYVDGNTARQIEEPPKKALSEKEEREARRRRAQARARQEKAQRRQAGLIRTAAVMAVTTVVLFLVISLLDGTVRANALTTEINNLEVEYSTILSQNDSKEYDIDRSVDLNRIIKTATEEYGMIRGNVDQIITYRTDDSEYIQQLAEIPGN